MNLFGSGRYTQARVPITPLPERGENFCLSEGHILGQVTHSLFLGDRRWVRLVFEGSKNDQLHLSKLEHLRSALAGAAFSVQDSFESPPEHVGVRGQFRKECTIRRPRHSAGTLSKPLQIKSGIDIPPALLTAWSAFDFHGLNSWRADVSTAGLGPTLRWLGQFADSIGFYVESVETIDVGFQLGFRRDRREALLYPLKDFAQANHWRSLVYYLNLLMGKSCYACNRPISRTHTGPSMSWCPVSFEDLRQGMLVSFEGLDFEQIRTKKKELGADVIAEGEVSLFFVPAAKWDTTTRGVFRLWVTERQGRYHYLPPLPRPYPRFLSRSSWIPPQDANGISIDLMPLGGGKEIGANSYLLRVGIKHILLDCGQDVAARGSNPLGLPRLEHLQPLSAILLSHAHTDHVGAILTAHTLYPDVPIYCTAETLDIMRVSILHHTGGDFVRRREMQLGVPLPPSKTWDEEFDNVLHVIPFDAETPIPNVPGLTFRFIRAGHILGAAGIGLTVGSRRILYTGDFCCNDQATVLGGAIAGSGKWDTVISEATNGAGHREVLGSVDGAVESLYELLKSVVERKGVALLPAFSLGKAQEVHSLLTKAIARHWPTVTPDRIKVAGLARDFFPIYAKFNASSVPPEPSGLGNFDAASAPAVTKRLLGSGPNFVIATHGMMIDGTISHSLGISLMGERRAAIVTTGYQAPGSLGAELIEANSPTGPSDHRVHHESLPRGDAVPVCEVGELRISGHAPLDDIVRTISSLSPKSVVLVHGSPDAVDGVKQLLSSRVPGITVATPTNLEVVDLGRTRLPEEAIRAWRKAKESAPQVHPGLITRAKKPRRSHPHLPPISLCVYFGDDEQPLPVRTVEGRDHVLVPLSPQVLKAKVRIRAGENLALSDYESVSLIRLPQGVGKPLIQRNRTELEALEEDFITESLSPGDYRLISVAKGRSHELLIKVVLNLEDEDEWVLERGADLKVDIPMVEGHSRMFSHLEVLDSSRDPDRGIVYNAIPLGDHLQIHFKDVEDRSRLCHVVARFRDPYTASTFRLTVGGPGPSDGEVMFDPSELEVGGIATVAVNRDDVSIAVATDLLGAAACKVLTERELEFDFRQPGEHRVAISIRKNDGHIRGAQLTVNVLPAFAPSVKETIRVPPSQTTAISLQLAHPETWALPRVESGELSCSVQSVTGALSLNVVAGPDLGQYPVRILAQRRRDAIECQLGQVTIDVSFKETIDFTRSLLVADGTGYVLYRSDSPISADRLEALLARFGAFRGAHEVNSNRKEVKVGLQSDPTLRNQIWTSIADIGVRLFNPATFGLSLSQAGGERDGRLLPGVSIQITSNDPRLRPFSEGSDGGIAVIRTSPLIEWVPVDRVGPGVFEIDPIPPGDYSVVLLHCRRSVFQRDFVIAEETQQWVPKGELPQKFSKDVEDEDFETELGHFISERKRAPMMIAAGPKGTKRIIESVNAKEMLDGYLERLSERDVLIFALPGNDVPPYVSGALFSRDLDWVALSYPAPRDPKPIAFEKAVSLFSAPMGTDRWRFEWHRFVPASASNVWHPPMTVACPTCGSNLVVDSAETPPVSRCTDCGFSSPRVHYALTDLRRYPNRIFVIQHSMLSYLHHRVNRESDWFGNRLVRFLHCSKCEFVSEFKSRKQIEQLSDRFSKLPIDRVTGELEGLVRGGWWERDGDRYVTSAATQSLRYGHCPSCCAYHDQLKMCGHTPLEDGVLNLQIILAGLDRFVVQDDDPFSLVQERFPRYHYPGLSGDQDSRSKVMAMIQAVEGWWRME